MLQGRFGENILHIKNCEILRVTRTCKMLHDFFGGYSLKSWRDEISEYSFPISGENISSEGFILEKTVKTFYRSL